MKTTCDTTEIETQILSPRFLALGLLAAVLLMLSLTGCSSSHPDTAVKSLQPADFAGEYALVSVNGNPVPAILHHENTDITVKSGGFSLRADGTCQSRSVFALPQGRNVDRVVEATYTVSGPELTMRWKGAGMTKGSVSGNTFTMNNEGMIFCYQR